MCTGARFLIFDFECAAWRSLPRLAPLFAWRWWAITVGVGVVSSRTSGVCCRDKRNFSFRYANHRKRQTRKMWKHNHTEILSILLMRQFIFNWKKQLKSSHAPDIETRKLTHLFYEMLQPCAALNGSPSAGCSFLAQELAALLLAQAKCTCSIALKKGKRRDTLFETRSLYTFICIFQVNLSFPLSSNLGNNHYYFDTRARDYNGDPCANNCFNLSNHFKTLISTAIQ